jgi:hypothetical protein
MRIQILSFFLIVRYFIDNIFIVIKGFTNKTYFQKKCYRIKIKNLN